VALSLQAKRSFNFAHLLTSVRLILIPFFLLAIKTGWQQPDALSVTSAISLFLLICASDYYDGPVARALGVDSDLGKVLDNLADITFLLVTLTYLVHRGTVPWWIPAAIALAFGQYTVDSWLLSRKRTSVVLVSNPIGHWAGILNYIFTGVMAFHTTLRQHLLPPLLCHSVLTFWLAYLLLAMGVRLRFFLRARRGNPPSP
jgi:phosphatidylglycerophosphate synthase